MKKLSIITICKNEIPFIKDTITSIVEQTYQNFEWIVIDGGSTDGTVELLNQNKSKINFFVSGKDTGIYNAMNLGIMASSGEFLIFMNGGDLLFDKHVLSKADDSLDDSADVFYGDSFRLFEKKDDCFIKTYPDVITKAFFLNNTLAHQSCFIKRNLFDRYGLYLESFKIVSDKEKWLTFLENNIRFKYLPFPVARYRQNGISQQKTPELADEKQKMFQMHNM